MGRKRTRTEEAESLLRVLLPFTPGSGAGGTGEGSEGRGGFQLEVGRRFLTTHGDRLGEERGGREESTSSGTPSILLCPEEQGYTPGPGPTSGTPPPPLPLSHPFGAPWSVGSPGVYTGITLGDWRRLRTGLSLTPELPPGGRGVGGSVIPVPEGSVHVRPDDQSSHRGSYPVSPVHPGGIRRWGPIRQVSGTTAAGDPDRSCGRCRTLPCLTPLSSADPRLGTSDRVSRGSTRTGAVGGSGGVSEDDTLGTPRVSDPRLPSRPQGTGLVVRLGSDHGSRRSWEPPTFLKVVPFLLTRGSQPYRPSPPGPLRKVPGRYRDGGSRWS